MSSAFAFPYKTIPTELCTLGHWTRIVRHGETEAVIDQISGWDYDSRLELGRSVELRPKSIFESVGLNMSVAQLSIVVTAETGGTSYRWLAYRTDVPKGAEWRHEIQLNIDSVHLAQRLSLVTEVVLAKGAATAGRFVPQQLGSRLFRDVQTIQLEGALGRFPMEMIDFGKGLPFLQAPQALWYLDWEPSRPDSHFLGTVLLYINSAHADVSDLIQLAEASIVSSLRCDIIRTMCQAMLRSEEFLSNYADYGVGTVGGQVREWLLLAFGDEKPELLQSKLDSSPGRFEARLQSTFS